MVILNCEPQRVPLRQDENGVIRVGNSRVLLELVIRAFQSGATPETIVQRYETLQLADVYAVISYYLTHKKEVEEYLRHQEELAAEVRQKLEAAQPKRSHLKEELYARFARREKGNASPGE